MSRLTGYTSPISSRPDSANLVDLHVYYVPYQIWRSKFNNLLNQSVSETISVGIIRVPPDMKLNRIRDEITLQLDEVPSEYIFLRSVGRSLTKLKAKQEAELKAKHFLPPVAYAPELYLLEATAAELRSSLTSDSSSRSQYYNLPSGFHSRRDGPYDDRYTQTKTDGSNEESGENRLQKPRNIYNENPKVLATPRYTPLPRIESRSGSRQSIIDHDTKQTRRHTQDKYHDDQPDSHRRSKNNNYDEQQPDSHRQSKNKYYNDQPDSDRRSQNKYYNEQQPNTYDKQPYKHSNNRQSYRTPRRFDDDTIDEERSDLYNQSPDNRHHSRNYKHSSNNKDDTSDYNDKSSPPPSPERPLPIEGHTKGRYDPHSSPNTNHTNEDSGFAGLSPDERERDMYFEDYERRKKELQQRLDREKEKHNQLRGIDDPYSDRYRLDDVEEGERLDEDRKRMNEERKKKEMREKKRFAEEQRYLDEHDEENQRREDELRKREEGLRQRANDRQKSDLRRKEERLQEEEDRLKQEEEERQRRRAEEDQRRRDDEKSRRLKEEEDRNQREAEKKGKGNTTNRRKPGENNDENRKPNRGKQNVENDRRNQGREGEDRKRNSSRHGEESESKSVRDRLRTTADDDDYRLRNGRSSKNDLDKSRWSDDNQDDDQRYRANGGDNDSQRYQANGDNDTDDDRDKRKRTNSDDDGFPSPPPLEMKSPTQGRDTDSSYGKRRDEKERLLAELDEAREGRKLAEHDREELVKRAKQLQHKTTHRRNNARDLWKKKYFEEKKRTSPLEDQTNRIRHELEILHRKLMSTLENSKDGKKINFDGKPSQKNNYIIQCTKLQHEIEDLRRRSENAKMKLTAEMKLRNQADAELRALRAELTQKKINLTLSRNHQLAALNPSPDLAEAPSEITAQN